MTQGPAMKAKAPPLLMEKPFSRDSIFQDFPSYRYGRGASARGSPHV